MKEIEVGEYVRLARNQGINKIIEIDEDGFLVLEEIIADEFGDECYAISPKDIDKEILKHHKIISEIVEVGDFVNGKRIHKIDKGNDYCYLFYGNCKNFVSYQIKEILTHEQYESNCYKVGV